MEKLSALKYLVWVSALSASIVTPIVICVLGAYYLKEHFSLGGWVMIVSIIVGLLSAGVNVMKFFRFVQSQADKNSDEEGHNGRF